MLCSTLTTSEGNSAKIFRSNTAVWLAGEWWDKALCFSQCVYSITHCIQHKSHWTCHSCSAPLVAKMVVRFIASLICNHTHACGQYGYGQFTPTGLGSKCVIQIHTQEGICIIALLSLIRPLKISISHSWWAWIVLLPPPAPQLRTFYLDL